MVKSSVVCSAVQCSVVSCCVKRCDFVKYLTPISYSGEVMVVLSCHSSNQGQV